MISWKLPVDLKKLVMEMMEEVVKMIVYNKIPDGTTLIHIKSIQHR